jgi:methionine sulfoxide reductase heme-binding subunit
MARATGSARYVWLGPGVLVGALLPLALLALDAARGRLGADPIALALNRFGLLALILLVACLAATPLRLMFGISWPLRIRRLLGLLAFFYACLHVLTYAVLDQGLALAAIWQDISERAFIALGALAFTLLAPLALTSTAAMRRRLGGVAWQRLHRLVYPATIAAAIHFVWRVKRDLSEPLIYAAIIGLLLLVRVRANRRRAAAPPKSRAPGPVAG